MTLSDILKLHAILHNKRQLVFALIIIFIYYVIMALDITAVKGIIESNTFIITDSQITIIIDAGAKTEAVKKALAGRKPEAVFLTHEHHDHVTYAKDYEKEFGCPVHLIDHENDIVIKALTIKPILCPGHSAKSVVYLIHDYLFTGDVLFDDCIGRTDFMKNGEELMQQSLKKLLDVKFTIAYHGHGDPSSYEDQIKNIKSFIY